MARDETRKPVVAGFVPGECQEHYKVDHDTENRVVTMIPKFDNDDDEPMEIPVGHVDPLFWYRAGFLAGVSERRPSQRQERQEPHGGGGGARIPPKP